ncbi:LysM peptidoglycan-binding domain-containing protein [Coraliomargarita sp. SDUM461004]|uniref:LysM peptidoglycan-binding domain-containing protein n=1 Tax=Thalassobacterium sedimentorum TaxID=3041258 RepID=A0ABU1ALF5_9BACT|nr:LysM peptidoglycan-binding domain-containing protein [Coraliomargarita sp. SDUM461004]MDQ8194423.1 LysM peptidoglycan-binding domain-containing protein [Coraliomargarita sp. SDUM461004]
MLRKFCYYHLIILALVHLIGCAPSGVEIVSETDEKQYQLGQDYKNQGRMEEALGAFLRVLEVRRDAPESHLEAGYIYLRTMKDPVRAIYHFDRYLQIKPQSPQATQVRQLIETAQKEFARQLPAQPYEGELDRIDLMDLVKTLKQENDSLKRDLMASTARVEQLENMLGQARRAPAPVAAQAGQSGVGATAVAPTTTAANSVPSPSDAPRTYTVQPGDTLSAISKRFYGTPSRWIDIYQANRDRLSSESALRVGQEVRIP